MLLAFICIQLQGEEIIDFIINNIKQDLKLYNKKVLITRHIGIFNFHKS